ncbi:MAG: glutamine--tRNA ligase/YqeY domain fusion protein [Bacteroidales bacterium]|jgi:glutaminyl-tRNA synthetase|nr:glutamine--tRNA ligase/YqeY domain fusion protein [Bacteroidales bacterium]MDD2570681.1 glutamine--tRNA ligase/YqeY domain fusion protein [Bacteroidales bacterium]MDD2813838.1 glutamine--tRNA ligase/YqeY domain fusion protein [Bacteroidales bacterium]MDD3812096.1 glutamine--tRNA ligase/YqeY domain fusion protein [Bacteroidales bacterium]MDD3870997.1 glutamine--tRNA ligase/YqeY domain fusion protein [Bacteroidales bacterium]
MTDDKPTPAANEARSLNFIEQIVEEDIRSGKHKARVHTRFPPEPNGYLHIGHAKAFCLDFGIAEKYGGLCNLRFDDTNPITEDTSYVDSIRKDIHWMGFDWGNREYYASDYFDQLYDLAVQLIKKGKAFVCQLTADEVNASRGTDFEPDKPSPYRDRPVEENLQLFERMKNGEFPNDSMTLRAKIDLSSPNMHMRDPILYRIRHAHHHRTGDKWCIYPMYDWAHGQSDSIEGITHSLCTLEFVPHRPLYEWFIRELEIFPSRQIEFARLNLSYTIMSKRKLLQLVKEEHVKGWDDPRMPTIHGLRRRGYTPESIRQFADMVGIAKRENVIDVALLEYCIREDLNKRAPRVMGVLNPVKLIIDNYPEGKTEYLDTVNNPEDPEAGTRSLPFSRELWIEREDFMEDPPKKFFRLSPGNEVRLKSAYIVKAESVEKDADGIITAIHCTYDPQSLSGSDEAKRKVKGTLHWVSAAHALDAEVRLYDRLFNDPDPDGHKDHNFKEFLNPDSLTILNHCKVEPSLGEASELDHFQFIRLGYFNLDPDSSVGHLVFNRTVGLKDTWAKMKQ